MLNILASDAHALKGGFGTVHCLEIPHYAPGIRAFPLLHSLCANTPCNVMNHEVDPYLAPSERQLLNRTKNQTGKLLMSKTADGMLFHIKDRLIAGMHGKSFYEPESEDPVHLFAIEDPSTTASQQQPQQLAHFNIMFHDGLCDAHELTRHAITEHILQQMLALKPPCPKGEPHIIFKSPRIGTFSTRLLKGPAVHELKVSFLSLVQKMSQQGAGVYNQTIRLKPEFSKLLMLKNASGNILCDRCVDGIVGYRVRPQNQKKTLIFVANSNDFHAAEPTRPEKSLLQVMKLDYADTSKRGARIILNDPNDDNCEPQDFEPQQQEEEVVAPEPEASADCPERCVSLDMTVQEMINQLEKYFREEHLENHNCQLFPLYCKTLADKQRQACNMDDLCQSFSRVAGG
jgi:hypothetical protein